MTKHRLAAMVAIPLLTASGIGQSASEFEKLHTLWGVENEAPPPKNFNDVIAKLLAYRKQSGGTSWQADYLLGVSYCYTPGDEAAGRTTLKRVLTGFQVTDAALKATRQVLSRCGQSAGAASSSSFEIVPVSGLTEGHILHGKGGYVVEPNSDEQVVPTQLSHITNSDLQARLFPTERTADALAAANLRIKSYSMTGGVVHGLIVEAPPYPGPKAIGDCLASYHTALLAEFGMADPPSLITVYAVDPSQVPVFAAALHGVALPLGTVAYSVVPDMSIIGVGGSDACGSLGHELTHLEIHQNFGDSPAWLEEGLASEVAVANIAGDRFRFMESWRDEELRRDWLLRPSVSKLLQLSWSDYSTDNVDEIHRVAATHAMAAVFIRYLDAKGKLLPMYTATRETLSSPHPQSPEDLLTATLGMTLEQIDADFTIWFNRKPS